MRKSKAVAFLLIFEMIPEINKRLAPTLSRNQLFSCHLRLIIYPEVCPDLVGNYLASDDASYCSQSSGSMQSDPEDWCAQDR